MAFLVLLVSAIAAYVGYCQLRIASAKLRMDLYNKRFAVYTAALDLYQACYENEDYIKLREVQGVFIRYFRESMFLFEDKDGVYKSLELMKNGAAKVSWVSQRRHEDKIDPNLHEVEFESRRKGGEMIEEAIHSLEVQMKRYLKFSDVDGWNNPILMMAGERTKSGYEWVRAKMSGKQGKEG